MAWRRRWPRAWADRVADGPPGPRRPADPARRPAAGRVVRAGRRGIPTGVRRPPAWDTFATCRCLPWPPVARVSRAPRADICPRCSRPAPSEVLCPMLPRQSRAARARARRLVAVSAAVAAPVRTEHVEAELVADHAAVAPGRHAHGSRCGCASSRVGTRIGATRAIRDCRPRSPGQLPAGYAGRTDPVAGAATRCLRARWSTTATKARSCTWSTSPSRATPRRASRVTLAARADWLVCRETCIPEGADLTLALPVARRRACARCAMGRADRGHARVAAAAACVAGRAAARGRRRRPSSLALGPPAGAADPGERALFPR